MFDRKDQRIYLLALALASASLVIIAASYAIYRTPKVNANGFTVPIAEGVSGPYEYLVGIWPPSPSTGDLHMAITVTANQHVVTDAVVSVQGTVTNGIEGVGPVSASSFLQPWVYELNLYLDYPGDWMFEIEINGLLGKTAIDVPLEVREDPDPVGKESVEQEPLTRLMDGQSASQKAAAGQALTAIGAGGLKWAVIVVPLAVLAVGVTAWSFRHRQSPNHMPSEREMVPPTHTRRRRR